MDATKPMSSGDLIPNDHDHVEPAANEVQFALVISRMIDTVKNSPEHMRQAVYDLARYKLPEQFADADAADIQRAQQALETAIRGVEEFSRQQIDIPPPQVPQLSDGSASRIPATDAAPPDWLRHIDPVVHSAPDNPVWPIIKRTAAMLIIVGGVFVVIQERGRLASLVRSLPNYQKQIAFEQPLPPARAVAVAPSPPAKPKPLRPTDYGVYAIDNDSLIELQPLPGRPPDIRVAVSAALKMPSHTVLPNGHPRFIVFRRDIGGTISDRAEVRIVAKIAREFSADAAGKKPEDGDTWVIRNVSFSFRASPLPDNAEMYELHSEDPALDLTPGRYALVLKTQAYDFTVEGKPVDPKQCIERIVASNGTFYTDCKKP
jgi:hypothetical protein